MVDLSVKIGSLTLANPVMPASGTFAEGTSRVFDLDCLGAIVTKTITQDIREGVPPPRVAEFRDATLFSIGIPSKGSDYYIEQTVPFYRRYTPPLVASISANTIEEFGTLAAKIAVPGVAAIEANVSCPNLKKDGRAFGMDPEATYQVVKAMKEACGLPVWAKMTPNAGNVVEVALAAEEAGADALVVSNAILAMAIDVETFRPRVANVMGGLTGAATRPIMLRIAYQCVQAVKIPVIGCGGIGTAADALEFLLAGCRAVQVGTANFVSPTAMPRLIHDLTAYCERHGVSKLSDLIGAVRMHEPVKLQQKAAL
ncbi:MULTISPECIES: dihydroorotate dehydrogenase [Paraburkholderia]|jgi:dihydroorotate dehydrogenase (NAD+) catalytic subunit|uniref:Dihydroorotate dehydrogenase n=1 Tax=Paraburkholderia aspalathi TaxID=1324617 RepID=A0A1I7EIL9_9BURK|nr:MULTISPECIES: dihydroorotate dehydrogenase [Paraburkholderia]MCP2090185.1 dihydroorotate dehydrogenase (NAD+) catalytic subunit [Paraburkholderia sediminicola]MBK3817953.1 dihydroorotate dehydrogenase [Paraburkholderia aspalathi]MBK3829805.1 dihydroorotate dehydrogenase [Paraburkholderia aspalathi]MBK3843508.1 dihydroorotate dehydrogenase [Paraburkholderia aspalathi]MBK3859516.1 dihydroorotate dehydrogenase [Paraburkholderia aspalathi]